jgi:hypothetical protein
MNSCFDITKSQVSQNVKMNSVKELRSYNMSAKQECNITQAFEKYFNNEESIQQFTIPYVMTIYYICL